MADIRINALATTAASTASDDYVAIDGSANGTRKLSAYSPTFGGNLTVSGTGTSTFSGPIRINASASAPTAGSFSTSAGNGLEIWPKSGSSYDLLVYTAAGSSLLSVPSGTNNLTLSGNLTVSGGTITGGTTGLSLASGGTNQNITLTPSGTGKMLLKLGDVDSQVNVEKRGTADIAFLGGNAAGSAARTLYFQGASVQFGIGGVGEVGRFAPSTGNFLVGTTTDDGQKLQVSGAIAATTGGANNGIIARYSSTANIFGITINSSGQSVLSENVDASSGSDKYSTTGYPSFRLGNVGGNATTPFWVDVAAAGTSGNAITWTNALKIDNAANTTFAGQVNSGTSSSSGYNNNRNVQLEAASARVIVNHDNGFSSGTIYVGFGYNGSGIGSITQDGTTGVLYNTTSDARLKTNIRDVTNSGSIIDALKPRVFDWKNYDDKDRFGFLAQEVYAVFPQAVKKGDDGEGVTDAWAMDAAKLVPVLVAEIKALRVRVAGLENQ